MKIKTNKSLIKDHLILFLATALIAGSFIFTEKVTNDVNAISLTLLRFLIGTICIAPFVIFKKNNFKVMKRVFPRSMIMSFFYANYFLWFIISLNSTNALNTGAIYTIVPFVTAIISVFILKQKFKVKQIPIYLVAIASTIWIIFRGDFSSVSIYKGDWIYLIAVFSMSAFLVSLNALYRGDDMKVVVFCNLLGGIFWLSLALLIFRLPLDWHLLQTSDIWSLLYLGVIATFFTMLLQQYTSFKLGPKIVSAYSYLIPIIIYFLLIIFTADTFSWQMFPAIVLSIAATVLLCIEK